MEINKNNLINMFSKYENNSAKDESKNIYSKKPVKVV